MLFPSHRFAPRLRRTALAFLLGNPCGDASARGQSLAGSRKDQDLIPVPSRSKSRRGRVRTTVLTRLPSENGQAFLALIVDVPRHMPTFDSVPVNDFVAGVNVPFAAKYSPLPPSGGM